MQPTPYERLGGDQGIRQLVDRFYDLMDSLPEVQPLRAMHPADLSSSRDKLYMFLSGWFGGPSLYVARYGHPMLRARHLPFPIDGDGRDQWLLCINRALDDTYPTLEADFLAKVRQAFSETADFMRNTPDPADAN